MTKSIQYNRYLWVDCAKGIGISLVVIQHICGGITRSNIGSFGSIFSVFNNIVYTFHMELFFFLSGLFVLKSIEKRGSYAFVLSKISTILYPYLLWSIIYMLIYFMFPNSSNNTNNISIFSIWCQPIFHFWFLQSLFVCQLICCYAKGRYLQLVLLVIAMWLYLFSGEIVIIEKFNKYLIFFVLGVFFRESGVKKIFIDRNHFLWLISSFLVWIGLYFINLNYYSNVVIQFFITISAIIFCVTLSLRFAEDKLFSIFNFLGYYSLAIYLIHYLAGTVSRVILLNSHITSSWFHVPVDLVVAFLVPILIYFFSQKLRTRFLFDLKPYI